jgi:hypothetical protein
VQLELLLVAVLVVLVLQIKVLLVELHRGKDLAHMVAEAEAVQVLSVQMLPLQGVVMVVLD